MLVEFKLNNFLSFKDEQVFSMVAASRLTELKDNKMKVNKDLSLLKSASVFGANASGKSNLLNGIHFMRLFVLESVKRSLDSDLFDNVTFALHPKNKEDGSRFEIAFLEQDTLFRYGFEIGKKKILAEWLYIDEEEVFTRNSNKIVYYSESYFDEKELNLKFNMTNEKSLFLTILAATNTIFAENITKYFKEKLIFVNGFDTKMDITKKLIKEDSDGIKGHVLKLLKVMDFSVKDLEIKKHGVNITGYEKGQFTDDLFNREEMDKDKLLLEHAIYYDEGLVVGSYKLDSQHFESRGTKVFIHLAGPIVVTLIKGGVLFIDDIDAQLHPLLVGYIIELFNSINNNKAQLIITSHNSTIMDNELFRRDQIWFAEKDKFEASHVTSLANYRFKGEMVRKVEKYEKNYLKGKYGAIPFIKPSNISEEFIDWRDY